MKIHIACYYRCRPGMTGLWQISAPRDKSYRERISMDVECGRALSVKKDFIILIETAGVDVRHVGAC